MTSSRERRAFTSSDVPPPIRTNSGDDFFALLSSGAAKLRDVDSEGRSLSARSAPTTPSHSPIQHTSPLTSRDDASSPQRPKGRPLKIGAMKALRRGTMTPVSNSSALVGGNEDQITPSTYAQSGTLRLFEQLKTGSHTMTKEQRKKAFANLGGSTDDGLALDSAPACASPRLERPKKDSLPIVMETLHKNSFIIFQKWGGSTIVGPSNQQLPQVPPPATYDLQRIVKAQAFIRGYLARLLRKQLMVANEILVTETNYVEALRVMVTVFETAFMRTSVSVVDPVDIHSIFSVTAELYQNHSTFCKLLQEYIRDVPKFREQGPGYVFLNHMDFVVLYPLYINNYNNALATLHKCKQNKQFAELLQRCEQKPECGFHNLESFLVMPIQRIPRYTMLLRDLLRRTNPASKPYEGLSNALQQMRKTVDDLNERKRLAENKARVNELLDFRFIWPSKKEQLPFAQQRLLLKEGRVSLLAEKKVKEVYLFLFSDVLLIATEKIEKKEMRKSKTARSGSSPVAVLTALSLSADAAPTHHPSFHIEKLFPVREIFNLDHVRGTKAFTFMYGKYKYEVTCHDTKEAMDWKQLFPIS